MIVIPMAGQSSRFSKAGYSRPKFMLPLQGKSVFTQSINSFRKLAQQEKFLFVCRGGEDTIDFINQEIQALDYKIRDFEIVLLNRSTSGQAETVFLGLEQANADLDDSLTIFNIDTFRPGFVYPDRLDFNMIDGYVEVFRGDGDGWSFVLPTDPDSSYGPVSKVTEKVRISDLCSTGLYYFRSTRIFKDAFTNSLDKKTSDLQGGERYVAPLYNDLISSGMDIQFQTIPREDVIFCGTPEEYEALLKTDFEENPDA